MLHQTNLSQAAQPIPYSDGAAVDAITAELGKRPASVRNATLDQIAVAPPSQKFCDVSVTFYSGLKARLAAMAGSASETEINRVASDVHQTLTALLRTPAPNLAALGHKLKLYGETDGYELIDADDIGKALANDAVRLIPQPRSETDADWAIATKCLNDIKEGLAMKGLGDDLVEALTNAETSATNMLLNLPSRNAADVITKVRALTALGTMVEVADLEPLMAELEAFTPATDADRPLLDAFATYRTEYRNLKAMPDDATPDEEAAQWDKIDPAAEQLLAGRAESIAGVMAKLTLAFTSMETGRWIDDAIVQPGSAAFNEGLPIADFYTRLMWSAIEDLSCISRVNLADAA